MGDADGEGVSGYGAGEAGVVSLGSGQYIWVPYLQMKKERTPARGPPWIRLMA